MHLNESKIRKILLKARLFDLERFNGDDLIPVFNFLKYSKIRAVNAERAKELQEIENIVTEYHQKLIADQMNSNIQSQTQ